MGRKHREEKMNTSPAGRKKPSGRIKQKLKAGPGYGKVLGKDNLGLPAAATGVRLLLAEKSGGQKNPAGKRHRKI